MGTRSLTLFEDEDGNRIAVLYRQFDGYPKGHGKELAEFLSGMTLISGIQDETAPQFANGMGCLAAQAVAHFKKEIGGFYLIPASKCDRVIVDYVYTVWSEEGQEPHIAVDDFSGPASAYESWLKSKQIVEV